MIISDLFGFIDYSRLIKFNGGQVMPAENFDKTCEWIAKYKNEDGFIYPPLEHRVKYDNLKGKKGNKIPNTQRPSLLHRLPASHVLNLEIDESKKDNLRTADSGFIVHLLAYIFGTRLQFHDWWFDNRVPIDATNNIHISHSVIEDFISHSYGTWRSWNKSEQKLFTNILFMYSRTPSYEWDWERFLFEYIVFDAGFALSKTLYQCKAKTHKERFKSVCDKFGIPFNEALINQIYRLRNGLFHESLWDGGQPCTGDNNAFMQPYNLRRFNARLVAALLGYRTAFVRTGWWFLGTTSFDKA